MRAIAARTPRRATSATGPPSPWRNSSPKRGKPGRRRPASCTSGSWTATGPGLVDPSWHRARRGDWSDRPRREIDALLVRGVGGPAPALEGVDLDGKPMALGDYRGKVVLLSFWATWCGPCMRLIPHERALAERFKDRPFAVVGVNGDEIEKLDRKLLETHKITWRSFRNKRPGQKAISSEWNVIAWPTLYLIDHTGTIRRRWSGTPPPDELDHEVARWVAVAEGKPLPPRVPRPGRRRRRGDQGRAGEVHRQGSRRREGRRSRSTWSASRRATTARRPCRSCCSCTARGRSAPTTRSNWRSVSARRSARAGCRSRSSGCSRRRGTARGGRTAPDGKRALAILEAVEREYATDPRRRVPDRRVDGRRGRLEPGGGPPEAVRGDRPGVRRRRTRNTPRR